MNSQVQRLTHTITSFKTSIRLLTEEGLSKKPEESVWSGKELIGHLIDSAIVNSGRFIDALLSDGPTTIKKYPQDELVTKKNYRSWSKRSLLNSWEAQNKMFLNILTLNQELLKNREYLIDGKLFDSTFLLKDYIDHIEHHFDQIFNRYYGEKVRIDNSKLTQTYEDRELYSLSLMDVQEYQMKCYSIHHSSSAKATENQLSIANALCKHAMNKYASNAGHGYGYIIIHNGFDGNYIIVSWWSNENMISQHAFKTSKEDFKNYEEVLNGEIVCVWDQEIHSFERDLWVNLVLSVPENPDFDSYISTNIDTAK